MKHEISGPRRNNTLQSWQLAQLCVNLLISSTDLGKTSLGERQRDWALGRLKDACLAMMALLKMNPDSQTIAPVLASASATKEWSDAQCQPPWRQE